jgi:hypothetical protein
MAAISLFWYTNMAAVTSDENDLLLLIHALSVIILHGVKCGIRTHAHAHAVSGVENGEIFKASA